VLGAQAARERSGRDGRQVNEARIAATTLEGLRTVLPRERLDAEMALGEDLTWLDVCALLANALPEGSISERE